MLVLVLTLFHFICFINSSSKRCLLSSKQNNCDPNWIFLLPTHECLLMCPVSESTIKDDKENIASTTIK